MSNIYMSHYPGRVFFLSISSVSLFVLFIDPSKESTFPVYFLCLAPRHFMFFMVPYHWYFKSCASSNKPHSGYCLFCLNSASCLFWLIDTLFLTLWSIQPHHTKENRHHTKRQHCNAIPIPFCQGTRGTWQSPKDISAVSITSRLGKMHILPARQGGSLVKYWHLKHLLRSWMVQTHNLYWVAVLLMSQILLQLSSSLSWPLNNTLICMSTSWFAAWIRSITLPIPKKWLEDTISEGKRNPPHPRRSPVGGRGKVWKPVDYQIRVDFLILNGTYVVLCRLLASSPLISLMSRFCP